MLTPATPVLSGTDEFPDLKVDFHATVATTTRAQAALERLEGAMLRSLKGLVLQPGESIALDNRRAVHGRTDFAPRYDGVDRWLRGSFVVTGLRPAIGHLGQGRSHAPVTPGRGRRPARQAATTHAPGRTRAPVVS
ncbi:hypothetical protein U9R90_17270 [Streptomyces sp. E11-3]|uniref:hypothetical protein n=1 Tax=Streptomyces sp. E11-3 TaxID=3110112 RepID=UPI003980BB9B